MGFALRHGGGCAARETPRQVLVTSLLDEKFLYVPRAETTRSKTVSTAGSQIRSLNIYENDETALPEMNCITSMICIVALIKSNAPSGGSLSRVLSARKNDIAFYFVGGEEARIHSRRSLMTRQKETCQMLHTQHIAV
jgi:hypothetical protein